MRPCRELNCEMSKYSSTGRLLFGLLLACLLAEGLSLAVSMAGRRPLSRVEPRIDVCEVIASDGRLGGQFNPSQLAPQRSSTPVQQQAVPK